MSVAALDFDTSTVSDVDTTSDLDSEWQAIGSTRGISTDTDDLGSEVSEVDSTSPVRWDDVIGTSDVKLPCISLYPEQAPAATRALDFGVGAGRMPLSRHPASAPSARHVFGSQANLSKDERVRTALDQSIVGTLKPSHSSGLGSRVRRLYFPCPLPSVRNDDDDIMSANDFISNQSSVSSSSNQSFLSSNSNFTIDDDSKALEIFTALETFTFQEITSLADTLIAIERPESSPSASINQDSKNQVLADHLIPAERPESPSSVPPGQDSKYEATSGYYITTMYVSAIFLTG